MPVLSNAKHERFAQELAKGKTADEAYQLAGYKENRHNASRLKTNETISGRIAELLERTAKRAEVTIEQIADQLDEDRQLAREVKSPSAAVAASLGKAKLYGLIRDKHEHSGPNGGSIKHDLSGIPDEKLAELAAILGSNPNFRGGKGRDTAAGDET